MHRDHTRGIPKVARLVKPEIVINAGHRDPFQKSRPLPFDGGFLEIIRAPAHSYRDLFVFDPKTGILFSGDAILGDGFGTNMGVEHTGIFFDSLKSIQQFPITAIALGHAGVIDPEAIPDLVRRKRGV